MGAQPLWDMVLIPASSLQLTWTSCHRGYITIWRPPTSCERRNFALNSIPCQSRSPLVSWYLWLDAPVIYTGTFLILTAWPGWRSIYNIRSPTLLTYLLAKFHSRVRVRESRWWLSLYIHRDNGVVLLWSISAFLLRSAWVEIFSGFYNFPGAHKINLPPTCYTWTHLFLTRHPHNLCWGTCILFT